MELEVTKNIIQDQDPLEKHIDDILEAIQSEINSAAVKSLNEKIRTAF